jgi:hypothetical protein
MKPVTAVLLWLFLKPITVLGRQTFSAGYGASFFKTAVSGAWAGLKTVSSIAGAGGGGASAGAKSECNSGSCMLDDPRGLKPKR